MEMVNSILSILMMVILCTSATIITIKICKYLKTKTIIDYKNQITSIGIKHYVDQTLNEYILDALEDEIKTNPDFINKMVITPKDEEFLLKKITEQVMKFMSDSFKEQMRMVYNIDIIVDNKGTIGLFDLVTRKVYHTILEFSIKANTPRSENLNIQTLIKNNTGKD